MNAVEFSAALEQQDMSLHTLRSLATLFQTRACLQFLAQSLARSQKAPVHVSLPPLAVPADWKTCCYVNKGSSHIHFSNSVAPSVLPFP